jgi:hypothetical protein
MNAILPRKMTKREMQALEGSIREQIAASVGKLSGNIEAIVLWQLYEQKGYSVEELNEFLEGFQPALQELKDFYDIEGQEDTELACVYNLKSIGFDTDKLGKAFPVEYTINGRK